jgi:HEPN domain-containing protein
MSKDDFDSLLASEIRWPRPEDRPFTKASSYFDNAHIEHDPLGRLIHMIDGYKAGADLMVERALEDFASRNKLVFPVVFSYRQFIELSLKYLISTYGPAVGIGKNWKTHDLGVLWKALMRVLKESGHEDSDGSEASAARIVAEFAKVDPQSFSYRYPVDKKGRLIPLEESQLDLRVLADVMDGLASYFDGCDGHLSYHVGDGL